jgi:hypothetical protein
MASNMDDVRAGRFTAQFARGTDAGEFYDRLAGTPADWYAKNIRRNRKGGRIVTWELDEAARDAALKALYPDWPGGGRGPVPDDKTGPESYWSGMCETVGY